MEIILDGKLMTGREAVHDLLTEQLNLPDYYGRNLDALFDMLSESGQNLNITLIHADVMLSYMGNYGNALIKTLKDAADRFENIEFLVSNEII